MASTAKQVYEAFKKHLENMNFKFDSHDDDLVISLVVHGHDLPQPTLIRVLEDRDVVQVVSPVPCKAPEDKRAETAIAVAVANYGMINGGFDLDMSDGEIRFRVSQGFHGIDFSDELCHYILQIAFLTTDKYNDRFFMLVKGQMSLEDFIKLEKQ